jgi:hypothetical protein
MTSIYFDIKILHSALITNMYNILAIPFCEERPACYVDIAVIKLHGMHVLVTVLSIQQSGYYTPIKGKLAPSEMFINV